MMRIIVITDTSFAASEAESIRILLSEGVDRVHLRKPQSAEADMRRLIEALFALSRQTKAGRPPKDSTGFFLVSA